MASHNLLPDAQKLADTIKAYWTERGDDVRVWIEAEPNPNPNLKDGILYSVRTDLVNGKPRAK